MAHTPEKSRPLASKLKRIYAPRVISDHIMVQEDFERLHKFLVETDGLSEGLSQFPSSAPGGSTRLSCGAGDAQLVLSQLSRQASPRGPRAGVFSFAAHTTRNQSPAAPGEDGHGQSLNPRTAVAHLHRNLHRERHICGDLAALK